MPEQMSDDLRWHCPKCGTACAGKCPNCGYSAHNPHPEDFERELRQGAGPGKPQCPKCGSPELEDRSHIRGVIPHIVCLTCKELHYVKLLEDFAQFFPSQERWVEFQPEFLVRVDHERFHGYGIVSQDIAQQHEVEVLLENGNLWRYDAKTVRYATADELEEAPYGIQNSKPKIYGQLGAPPETQGNAECTCGFLRGSAAIGSTPCPVHSQKRKTQGETSAKEK